MITTEGKPRALIVGTTCPSRAVFTFTCFSTLPTCSSLARQGTSSKHNFGHHGISSCSPRCLAAALLPERRVTCEPRSNIADRSGSVTEYYMHQVNPRALQASHVPGQMHSPPTTPDMRVVKKDLKPATSWHRSALPYEQVSLTGSLQSHCPSWGPLRSGPTRAVHHMTAQ